MNTPSQFYKEQLEQHSKTLDHTKKQLNTSSLIRLLVFLGVGFAVYCFWSITPLVVGAAALGIIGFLLLLTRHGKLQYKRDIHKSLMDLCEVELKVLNRDFLELPDGEIFKNPNHHFSQDIDLFGRASFFQYINRAALASGTQHLANLLQSNDIQDITLKQEAIKELAQLPFWRLQFAAMASLVKTEIAASKVVNWLKSYTPFVPKNIGSLAISFSIVSVVLTVIYFLGLISGWIVFAWFLLGLAITGRFLKKINTLSAYTSQIQSTFEQYYKIVAHIEDQQMSSTLLSTKRNHIIFKTEKASEALKRFSKLLDALDQRNNMLIGVLTNGFFLRDLNISSQIESWIAINRQSVNQWFEAIVFFDAYNSLGNYAFNHPEQQFPEITDTATVLDTKAAGHPLLNPENCVYNDFNIDNEQFFIITGANMAGKSTFLRTVALQIAMANVGLPLCAQSVVYNPIKLITSMRTTDSLTDDESYFYSELKRLKFIVDTIKEDRYFIILDEILKGTNSTDKAIGSRKFVNKLVASKSTGIIATHDLSLTKAADELPEVENYFFDAQITNDELYFDYTIKDGICQNMNASFLLKKMEIVD